MLLKVKEKIFAREKSFRFSYAVYLEVILMGVI